MSSVNNTSEIADGSRNASFDEAVFAGTQVAITSFLRANDVRKPPKCHAAFAKVIEMAWESLGQLVGKQAVNDLPLPDVVNAIGKVLNQILPPELFSKVCPGIAAAVAKDKHLPACVATVFDSVDAVSQCCEAATSRCA
jgi:hypothetical protein